MSRLNAIVTAYACEPGKGSEPGIGWNIVREVCKKHNLTVITRPNNRPAIEASVNAESIDGLKFIYYDPPKWATWWKHGTRGLFIYYYLWQLGAYRIAKKLVGADTFHVAHHVTFGRYWSPSFLYRLGLPVVWGPVGGGESTPPVLMATLPIKGRVYERLRALIRMIGERDPFVRAMARQSDSILATTSESYERIAAIGARNISVLGNAALDMAEIDQLARLPAASDRAPVFASIGRLLHWKGFHLGLRAFAVANIPGSEYWIVGDGPAESYLRKLAGELGILERVKFTGKLTRDETLDVLATTDVLVHPSFHDSGGWVCIEAMAAGRPVIALDLGGPALLVSDNSGIKVRVESVEQVVADLSNAMIYYKSAVHRDAASHIARRRARSLFTWQEKGSHIAREYFRVVGIPDSEVTPNPQAEIQHQLQ